MPYSASRKLQLSGFFSQSTAGDSIHHRLSFLTRDSLAALNDSPLRSLTPSLTHWSISRNKSYLDTGVHPERCLLIPNTEADPVLLSNWVRGFSHNPYLGFSKECWQGNPHMEVLLGIRENASGSLNKSYCSQGWKDNVETDHFLPTCQLQLLLHKVTEDSEWGARWKQFAVLHNSQQCQGSIYHAPAEYGSRKQFEKERPVAVKSSLAA